MTEIASFYTHEIQQQTAAGWELYSLWRSERRARESIAALSKRDDGPRLRLVERESGRVLEK